MVSFHSSIKGGDDGRNIDQYFSTATPVISIRLSSPQRENVDKKFPPTYVGATSISAKSSSYAFSQQVNSNNTTQGILSNLHNWS